MCRRTGPEEEGACEPRLLPSLDGGDWTSAPHPWMGKLLGQKAPE